MPILKFPNCNCEFEVDEKTHNPKFVPDITKIPLDCPEVWRRIGEGQLTGIFQLESNLGKKTAKELKPTNIEELSALISIIRPGCKNAILDGKTITDHYIDRKNGNEEISYFHKALEPALKKTLGLMIYQENAMQIVRDIADFDLKQADNLRKSIGKKDIALMGKMKKEFLKGSKKKGLVTEKEAEEIFGWIEASQRYGFNKSHGVAYAMNSYLAMYTKVHLSKIFFTSWLYYSQLKKQKRQEEICGLVNDCRLLKIVVAAPDLRLRHTNFKLVDGIIYFGICDLKGVGISKVNKLYRAVNKAEKQVGKNIEDFTWIEFLLFVAPYVDTTSIKAIISTGGVDYFKHDRSFMLYQYKQFTDCFDTKTKEIPWAQNWYLDNKQDIVTLIDILKAMTLADSGRKEGCSCSSSRRKKAIEDTLKIVEKPAHSIVDSIEFLSRTEEELLGISLSCHEVDGCKKGIVANCNCYEFVKKKNSFDHIIIACKLDSVNEWKTKKSGKMMAFVRISDGSCAMDNVVVFPDQWEKLQPIIQEGNKVILSGHRGDKDSFIVQNAKLI